MLIMHPRKCNITDCPDIMIPLSVGFSQKCIKKPECHEELAVETESIVDPVHSKSPNFKISYELSIMN